MRLNRDIVLKIVLDCIKQFEEESEIIIDLSEGETSRLFGGDGPLDSLALVSLIVEIEEAIEIELGESIILADEKAMSRRTSPFSRVNNLVDYIVEISNN